MAAGESTRHGRQPRPRFVGHLAPWALPAVLLLDEALGALDALTRIGMQPLIESLWQRQRFSAVLVAHDVRKHWHWRTGCW